MHNDRKIQNILSISFTFAFCNLRFMFAIMIVCLEFCFSIRFTVCHLRIIFRQTGIEHKDAF
jgi:hypothetical protein